MHPLVAQISSKVGCFFSVFMVSFYQKIPQGGHSLMKNLGEQIYFYRTKCGFSQLDIAEKLEVSRQSVSKWENNSATPELAKLVKLCELFGITLDELVNGESTPPDAISAPIIDSDADRDKIIITIKKPSFHPVKNTVVAHLSPKRIAGLCILGIGILFLLIMNLFAWHGDAYSSFLWGILFLTCFAICFCEHRHCALLSIWCVWGFFYSFYQIRSNTPAFAISVTVILALATILIRLKTSPISLMPAIAGALSAVAFGDRCGTAFSSAFACHQQNFGSRTRIFTHLLYL